MRHSGAGLKFEKWGTGDSKFRNQGSGTETEHQICGTRNSGNTLDLNRYRRKRPKLDASIFDSALSHTRRSDATEKREEKSESTFGRFRLWTSFESSPVSVKPIFEPLRIYSLRKLVDLGMLTTICKHTPGILKSFKTTFKSTVIKTFAWWDHFPNPKVIFWRNRNLGLISGIILLVE